MSRILVTVGELKIASAQKVASLLGFYVVSTGNDGINHLDRWNCWDSFSRGRNFLSVNFFLPEIFGFENFKPRFFLRSEFFIRKIFAIKKILSRFFPCVNSFVENLSF